MDLHKGAIAQLETMPQLEAGINTIYLMYCDNHLNPSPYPILLTCNQQPLNIKLVLNGCAASTRGLDEPTLARRIAPLVTLSLTLV